MPKLTSASDRSRDRNEIAPTLTAIGSGIQTLPAEVVNLIAAGEVIDSISAVVRELVENAIDAGATRIVVSLWPSLWRVRVADNGTGMVLADLLQAAKAHSTSKIRRCEDLWKITSLGFRGEALHSLVQLSSLEILSRATGSESGWRVIYNSPGESVQVANAAISKGTIVTASNIFGTWPVRRQGLPPPTQQMRAVQSLIQLLAMCHPHITWQVQQNGRDWFSISSAVSAQEILPQILRQVRLSDLQQHRVEVPSQPKAGEQGKKEEGEKGTGGAGEKASREEREKKRKLAGEKGRKLAQKSPRAVTQEVFIPSPTGGELSSVYLVLGLPDRCHRRRPDWVRVATNGRLVRSPELEQTILEAFGRTLPRDRYPIFFLHLQISPDQIDWNRHPAKSEIYLHNLSYWQNVVAQAISEALRISPANLPEALHTQRVGQLLKATEAKLADNASRASRRESTAPKEQAKRDIGLIELLAVAQVHNTYILAEHPTGLLLVEQHIAHERVLYEQLCLRWQLVPLNPPKILSQISPAQLEQLQRLGMDVEPFGDRLWAVRTAPALLAQRDDCSDALLELSLGGDLQAAQVAVACRSAIRNNTSLNLQEMQTLLDEWKRTNHPRTCPHGRPIYLSLEESALARFFRRNWVLGKSHGI